MPPVHPAIEKWVKEIAALTTPDQIVYCDGSAEEGERLTGECVATGELIELNQKKDARLLPPPQRLARRRPHRTSDLHQHRTTGRRRPQQQLDVAGRRARQADARSSRAP